MYRWLLPLMVLAVVLVACGTPPDDEINSQTYAEGWTEAGVSYDTNGWHEAGHVEDTNGWHEAGHVEPDAFVPEPDAFVPEPDAFVPPQKCCCWKKWGVKTCCCRQGNKICCTKKFQKCSWKKCGKKWKKTCKWVTKKFCVKVKNNTWPWWVKCGHNKSCGHGHGHGHGHNH